MTNEQIEQALKDLQTGLDTLRDEYHRVATTIPVVSASIISDGPDEFGRVRFTAVDKALGRELWVLSQLTLQQGLTLTDKQKACIQVNVGCDEKGNLQGAGPLAYQNGVNINGMPRPVSWKALNIMGIKYGNEAWRTDDYPFSDKSTIASRFPTPEATAAQVLKNQK